MAFSRRGADRAKAGLLIVGAPNSAIRAATSSTSGSPTCRRLNGSARSRRWCSGWPRSGRRGGRMAGRGAGAARPALRRLSRRPPQADHQRARQIGLRLAARLRPAGVDAVDYGDPPGQGSDSDPARAEAHGRGEARRAYVARFQTEADGHSIDGRRPSAWPRRVNPEYRLANHRSYFTIGQIGEALGPNRAPGSDRYAQPAHPQQPAGDRAAQRHRRPLRRRPRLPARPAGAGGQATSRLPIRLIIADFPEAPGLGARREEPPERRQPTSTPFQNATRSRISAAAGWARDSTRRR